MTDSCQSGAPRHLYRRWVKMDANQTRVVIADDHPLLVKAISQVLEDAKTFEVVGSASSGLQVEPLVSRTRPNLVLLDVQMPGLDGLSCLGNVIPT
jgi:DNA-binding NarL/FixJ family response regulator